MYEAKKTHFSTSFSVKEVGACSIADFCSGSQLPPFISGPACQTQAGPRFKETFMPKKKISPSGGAREEKRRFRWLLYQKPKAYPSRPISNKKDMLKPIRRS